MVIWVYQLPASMAPDEPPERIIAYLQNNQVPAATATIDGSTVVIDGPIDPGAVLASYVSQPTKEEQAWSALRAYIQNVRTILPSQRTPEQKVIFALAVLAREDI